MSVKRARESRNLFDPNASFRNGYINGNGDFKDSDAYRTQGQDSYYAVTGGNSYTLSIMSQYSASRYVSLLWWDSEGDFISWKNQAPIIPIGQRYTLTAQAPMSAAYVSTNTMSNDTDIMLNEGSSPLPYEPYGATIWEPCAVKRYASGGEQNNSSGTFTYKGLTLIKNRADIKATGTSTDIISSTDQFFKDNFSVLLEAGKTYTILGQNTVVDDSYIDVRYRDSDAIITTGYYELPTAVMIAPNTDTYIYMGIGLSAGVQCSKGNFTAKFYRQAGWHDTPVYVRQNGVWVVQT